MVNKKRKSPLQLHLDDETEKLFRQVAEKEVRDLSGQFKIIFREWLSFRKGKVGLQHRTDIEAGRVGEIAELGDVILGETGEKADTSKSASQRHPKQ